MDGGWTATTGSHHFIGNRWVPSATGQTIDVVDPSDGAPFARIARGNAADVDAAVKAARHAVGDALDGPWGRTSPAERGRLLLGPARHRGGDRHPGGQHRPRSKLERQSHHPCGPPRPVSRASQPHSSLKPCSSVNRGVKPRSVFAREVSAKVSRMSPFWLSARRISKGLPVMRSMSSST